jgi:hypothetical protein
MNGIHIRGLSDDELRPQLEAGNSLFILDPTLRLREIEQQVERLGFGEEYIVSATQGSGGERAKIRLKPQACRKWKEVDRSQIAA